MTNLSQTDTTPPARLLWSRGEWKELIEIYNQNQNLDKNSQEEALYCGIAQLQIGELEAGRALVERAAALGTPRNLLTKTLVASVHNTLGKLAACLSDRDGMKQHFESSLANQSSEDYQLSLHIRTVNELRSAGLPSECARELTDFLSLIQSSQPISNQPYTAILKSQISILQHELSLSLQRGQTLPSCATPTEPARSMGDMLAQWKINLTKRATSQLGQELWVLEQLKYKSGGYFVEFGATDGVLLSNTYILETEFGWSGICAEPNPLFFEELKKNRKCKVVDACIAGKSGEKVEFVLADVFGGLEKYANADMHAAVRAAYKEERNTITLDTISLHDLLISLGAPKEIDYISIDTEGSELEIIESFPFDQWDVKTLTVEHNYSTQREMIHSIMQSFGYRRIEAQWDDWFIKAN